MLIGNDLICKQKQPVHYPVIHSTVYTLPFSYRPLVGTHRMSPSQLPGQQHYLSILQYAHQVCYLFNMYICIL